MFTLQITSIHRSTISKDLSRSGTEARDLESLVRSVEGKAKARRSTAGSTSTAFAEHSEMGVASAFQASSGCWACGFRWVSSSFSRVSMHF